MKIRKLPDSERPREKLLREGKERLSNTEILAIIIGSGTGGRSALDLASEVISLDSTGIRFLAGCRPEELQRVKGIGRAKACEILAAAELGKRIATRPHEECTRIERSSDIAELFMEKMRISAWRSSIWRWTSISHCFGIIPRFKFSCF